MADTRRCGDCRHGASVLGSSLFLNLRLLEEVMSKTNPSHYQLGNGVQVIDVTETLDFCSGNVVKYVVRAGNKEGESSLDDLEKALWYLVRRIENARKSENIG